MADHFRGMLERYSSTLLYLALTLYLPHDYLTCERSSNVD